MADRPQDVPLCEHDNPASLCTYCPVELDLGKPKALRHALALLALAPMQTVPYDDPERGWVDDLDDPEMRIVVRRFLHGLWVACERAERGEERTISLDDLKRKYGFGAPTEPDGTVRLPAAVEAWLDGHFAGEKDDDPDDLEAARNIVAVALWSLMYHQGDPDDDQAALDALVNRGSFDA